MKVGDGMIYDKKEKSSEETLKEQLEIAIDIMAHFHKGQRDKNNDVYMMHPLRIMLQMESHEEKIVAVLHDVLEDTKCNMEYIMQKIDNKEIIDALYSITRKTDEKYFDYIRRVSKNKIAKEVKIKDLQDNLSRKGASQSLIRRYEKALKILEG